MNKPRRQHTIPKFLLRNFTDSSGCTYYFRKTEADLGIIKISPNNLFVEKDRNSIIGPNGDMDYSLEDHFAELEGVASATINKILDSIRDDKMPVIDSNDRIVLNFFVYHQWARVSDVMDRIVQNTPFEKMVENAKQEVVARCGTVSLSEENEILADKKRLLHNARVQTMATKSGKVIPMLEARGLTIAHIRQQQLGFVIGSNPVLKSTRNGKSGLDDLDVEVILPVAPDTALVLHGESQNTYRVDVIDNRQMVRGFNEAIFAQSSGIVSQSEQLLQSLAGRFDDRV